MGHASSAPPTPSTRATPTPSRRSGRPPTASAPTSSSTRSAARDLRAGVLRPRPRRHRRCWSACPTPDMTLELPLIEFFGRGGALKSSWYGDCLPTRDFPMLIDLYLQGRLPLAGVRLRDDRPRRRRGRVREDAPRRGAALGRGAVAVSAGRARRHQRHVQPRRQALGTSTTTSGSSATTTEVVVIDAAHDAGAILAAVGDRARRARSSAPTGTTTTSTPSRDLAAATGATDPAAPRRPDAVGRRHTTGRRRTSRSRTAT